MSLQVLFRFAHSDWRHLNAIQESRSNNCRSHEVNCGPDQFAWRLQVYDDVLSDPSEIRAGNPLLLFHKEMDGFFTAKPRRDEESMVCRLCVCVCVRAHWRVCVCGWVGVGVCGCVGGCGCVCVGVCV